MTLQHGATIFPTARSRLIVGWHFLHPHWNSIQFTCLPLVSASRVISRWQLPVPRSSSYSKVRLGGPRVYSRHVGHLTRRPRASTWPWRSGRLGWASGAPDSKSKSNSELRVSMLQAGHLPYSCRISPFTFRLHTGWEVPGHLLSSC